MIFPRVKIIVPCALLGLFFLSATEGSAQSFALKGVVRDRATSDPLAGANVVLTNVLDTTEVYYGTTDLNGIFMFSRLMGET
ncbi:MAG: carboxypeptidase regulatory-like domain-containing protein, partial [Proteobacteria bacterium]|nr:carboxypeptidase regulatory-like domain-containing protein [Pseudomonadota bacterium]